jgi:hypothetical protein
MILNPFDYRYGDLTLLEKRGGVMKESKTCSCTTRLYKEREQNIKKY